MKQVRVFLKVLNGFSRKNRAVKVFSTQLFVFAYGIILNRFLYLRFTYLILEINLNYSNCTVCCYEIDKIIYFSAAVN